MAEENEKIEVYSDSQIRIVVDKKEPEGYIAIVNDGDYAYHVLFPRGTLRDIARMDRDDARMALENLLPFGSNGFKGDLTIDSLIAAATKAYYIDEERINRGAARIREEMETQNL